MRRVPIGALTAGIRGRRYFKSSNKHASGRKKQCSVERRGTPLPCRVASPFHLPAYPLSSHTDPTRVDTRATDPDLAPTLSHGVFLAFDMSLSRGMSRRSRSSCVTPIQRPNLLRRQDRLCHYCGLSCASTRTHSVVTVILAWPSSADWLGNSLTANRHVTVYPEVPCPWVLPRYDAVAFVMSCRRSQERACGQIPLGR